MSITFQYDVPDVVCGFCSSTIENALKKSPLFKNYSLGVDPVDKKLTITLEDDHLSYLEIRDLVNEIIERVGHVCVESLIEQPIKSKNRDLSHRVKGAIGIGVGTLFLLLSFIGLPINLMWITTFISLPLTLYLGAESYQKAWSKIKFRTLTMDSLFAISTLSISLVSVASLFFPMLPMMCEAGLLIFGFRHIGLAIEHAFKSNRAITQRFQDAAPRYVNILKEGKELRILLSEVQQRDILLLNQGDILPVDGIFEESDGLISDSIVTGSHMPRRIDQKETLYAGSILTQAQKPLRFRATSTGSSSHLARLDIKIARAKLEKSTLETVTNQILQYFIPSIVGIAIISGITVGLLFTPVLGIQCAISVLVSACPCTLGLITPLAIRIGIKKAADAGVVFNSAKKLEAADGVHCVVFDLNGTLTQGMPQVMRYHASFDSNLTHDEMLSIMAHLEKGCPHPVARAIQAAATAKQKTAPTSDIVIEATDHAGRILNWEGQRYILGSEALMIQQGIAESEIAYFRKMAGLKPTESMVYLARENRLIGYVVVHDSIRKEADYVIRALRKMGKEPYLCTGADLKTALQYAKILGIPASQVRANCVSHANSDSIHSKKNVIDELRKKGCHVAAIGDGGNDAEMIAAADVGFAISSGGADSRTQQQASAVIQWDSILPVLHAFSIAKRTVSNIKENLAFSLLYNVATVFITSGLLLTVGLAVNPAVGAALMILQTSLILMNVYLFSRQPAISHTPQKKDESVTIRQQSVNRLLPEAPKPKISCNPAAVQKKSFATITLRDSRGGHFLPVKEFVEVDHQHTLRINAGR